MIKLYNNFNIQSIHKKSIILIGNFDGLHLGHQKLFYLAKRYKKKFSLKIGVLTFEPMPKMYFNKKIKNFRISNKKQKINLLNKLNVDFIIIKKFNKKFSKIKSIDFILENFLSNFFIITKSTLNLLSKLIFCFLLDILKFLMFLLKYILGIGSNVKTPTFKEKFFLYLLAK